MNWRDKIIKRDEEIISLFKVLRADQVRAAYEKSADEDGILCYWKLLENLRNERQQV